MTIVHNQTPTATLTEIDYETVLLHLTDQIAGCCPYATREDDYKNALDALSNTYGTAEDQTILDWLTAACRRMGVSADDCVGV